MAFPEFKSRARTDQNASNILTEETGDVFPMDRGYTALSAGIHCFEISWEVVNKVGGIYTVIRTKAAQMMEAYGDQYIMIGPLNENLVKTEVDEYHDLALSDLNPALIQSINMMRSRGVKIVVGRWLLETAPIVVLFDISTAAWHLDGWKAEFFDASHIGIPLHDQEALNAVIFGFLVTWFLGEYHAQLVDCGHDPLMVAHFHEWLAGVGVLMCRTRALDIATVFTTHATLLGRYMCASGSDFYNNLPFIDVDKEAGDRNIYHRYSMERAAAQSAHIFTTVSEVTALEAEHLLKRKADIITPNGLNLKKFAALHEFQNLHAKSKEKINDFVKGHFYGHLNFDLDRTIYFFIAGRYEFANKGADMFLEAMARLNHKLHIENVDVTVVSFMIFPAKTDNFNVDSLKGQAIVKQLHNTIEEIHSGIGKRLFTAAMKSEILDGSKMFMPEDRIKLKRCILSLHRDHLPPVVTHNMVDDLFDPILSRLRELHLYNHPDQKVKVIFHPEFLSSTSPLLALDYEDFVRGTHMGIFPSYYEPWGYTPAECTVMGIPSVSTNLSGFGCFMTSHVADPNAYGIYVVDRRFCHPEDSMEQLTKYLLDFCKLSRRQRIILRNRTERLSPLLDWKNLASEYFKAHVEALYKQFPEKMEDVDRRYLGYKLLYDFRMVPKTYSATTSPASSRVPSEYGDDYDNEDGLHLEDPDEARSVSSLHRTSSVRSTSSVGSNDIQGIKDILCTNGKMVVNDS